MLGNGGTGGEIGIRTLDTRKRILDFESSAFDHSAISPRTPNYTGFAPSAPWPDLPRYFFAGAAAGAAGAAAGAGAAAAAGAAAGAAGAGAAIAVGVTTLPFALCSAM